MSYNGSLTAVWAASTESDLAGYKLYAGSASRVYDLTKTVTTTGLSGTISGLASGVLWYLAITAFDANLNESTYSAEVSQLVTVPILQVLRRVA